jgi:hypothetical protein
MKRAVALLCAVAALAAGSAGAEDAAAKQVAFPKDYRGWTHVKSMLIYSDKHPLFDAFGGIHHVYANDKALRALKGNRDFPNGSVLVFDLKESPESSGAYAEGKRKITAVMVRDTKKYADTQGWGFQGWAEGDPNKPALKMSNDQKVCATCHQQNTKDMVFTTWTDTGPASATGGK